jgi:hypothetical protein
VGQRVSVHEVLSPRSDTKKVLDGGILASSTYDLDPIPRGLKPLLSHVIGGTAEAVPFPIR